MYRTIRSLHRILASLTLPFLVMYGISAVQMAHGSWFVMRPAVAERALALPAGVASAREVARAAMDQVPGLRGELTNVQVKGTAIALRITVPGTVHDVNYDAATGATRIRTSVAGVMGMLNRLHHAAGLWHEDAALQAWGAAVAVVSVALLAVGGTGVYMWFLRRTERRLGTVLLVLNVVVAVVLMGLLRRSGP